MDERIQLALNVASQYGQTDGAHHKQWVIDQMVRALCGGADTEEYRGFAAYGWDQGIAP